MENHQIEDDRDMRPQFGDAGECPTCGADDPKHCNRVKHALAEAQDNIEQSRRRVPICAEPITCENCGITYERGDTTAAAQYDFCSQSCEEVYRIRYAESEAAQRGPKPMIGRTEPRRNKPCFTSTN